MKEQTFPGHGGYRHEFDGHGVEEDVKKHHGRAPAPPRVAGSQTV